MLSLAFLIVIGTSIWVLFDAKALGFGKRQLQKGCVDAGPWIWFLSCLGLWIVAFPFYLLKRGRYKRLGSIALTPSLATLSDSITQLERLPQLIDKGVIAEQEFLDKKNALLAYGRATEAPTVVVSKERGRTFRPAGLGVGVMAQTVTQERRVFGSHRRMRRQGGRRQDDHTRREFDLRIACEACDVGWASISSLTYGGQSLLCFTCPRCGHLEQRAAVA